MQALNDLTRHWSWCHSGLQSASLSQKGIVQPKQQRETSQKGVNVHTVTDVVLLNVPKCVWLLDYLHFTGEPMVYCVKTTSQTQLAPPVWYYCHIKQDVLSGIWKHLLKTDTQTIHSLNK